MKTLKLITLLLTFTLTYMHLPALAKDREDHTLVKMWAEYYKAQDDDRPKDQADILLKIKKEALAQHLTWDYYDATWKYVDVRSSTNWKLADELRTEAVRDIEKFGEPVAVFYNRRTPVDSDQLLKYVKENKSRLEQTYNPEFHGRDDGVLRHQYHVFLLSHFKNDYEYALWSLFGSARTSTAIAEEITGYFAGRYPFDALVEYTRMSRKYSGDEIYAPYEDYIRRYEGKSVSLLARELLLMQRQNELRRKKAGSDQYRQLAADCERFIADRKKITGEEKEIADCCVYVDGILDELNSQEINTRVEKGVASILLRNIPSARVRILDGKKELFDRTLDNPVRSYYVMDTLTLDLPALDDGTYTLKVTGGKATAESEYHKYTLGIATKRDLDGYGAYVADYITGEPVRTCNFLLRDGDGKVVDELRNVTIDGFTYLPESFTSRLQKDRWGYSIQAVVRDGDRVRMSQDHSFYYRERETVGTDNPALSQVVIITDRSAFNPDETVHFKVLLYEGVYEFATRPAGIKLGATLTDATGKVVGETALTTNEFGSAAGAFVLKKGERGGMYTIKVSEGENVLGSTRVRVDEFVLPTFELTWKPDDRFYLPGDTVLVQGNVRSYSGHNLATATARYRVRTSGNILSEDKLELSPSGDFSIRFTAPERGYFNNNSIITVTVTDSTGETLEFNNTVMTTNRVPFNISVLNESPGRFSRISDSRGGSIVGEDAVRIRFQTGFGKLLTHPGVQIGYKVLHDGKTILEGSAVNGETLSLDLSGQPSGLYTVEAEASVKNDAGREFTQKETVDVVKAADTDTALDLDVQSFFKEIPDEDGIALQIGTTDGPAWVVVELYGDGNRLLEKQLVKLEGVRARDGSLRTLRFPRKPGYPEGLTLKVFWFRNGSSFEYSVFSDKPVETYQLPLHFSRFLDTTAPHHDYSFTIRTGAGTEVAATIFDKSTETILSNRWSSVLPTRRWLPGVEYDSTNGTDSSYGYAPVAYGAVRGRTRLSKAAGDLLGSAPMQEMAMVNDSADMMARQVSSKADVAAADEEAEENTAIRENFANTIAWEPFLRSDQDGVVTFNFTTADKLSTYYVQLFAHDKAFHNATLRQEMVVTLPVKVAVVQPQYLYEGDRYVARVTLANSKDVPVSGRLAVRFLNGTDYQTAPVVQEKAERITVPANGSADFVAEISAPALRNLGLLVNFTADETEFGSDGVFVTMPVSPAVQTILEAHSALLRAGMDREAVIARLRSEFVNVFGADAAMREISIIDMIREAIPDKVIPASENLLDQSEALFANYLLDILPGKPVQGASAEERQAMVDKVLGCRNTDGGFGWFAGMNSSPVLTAVLLERFAAMGDACPQALSAKAADAVRYLDAGFFGDGKRPYWCGRLSLDQYLHVRALYPEVRFDPKGVGGKELREFKKTAKEYLVPGAKRGLNGQVFAKARRIKTLRALIGNERGKDLAKAWGISLFTAGRLRSSLDKDITSLLQYAEPHRSGGTYYPNAVMPWRGLLESELYAHALICDLMTDCGHDEVAEGIRLWIMVQKETQQWEDDPAYIQAIGSVLHGTEETLQTKVIALSASTTLPFRDIKASGNGFTVSRSFTRDGKLLRDGDVLHVGDKVTATYSIWNEENRSFVRLTAPRPAAFRPVDQLSGRYGWFARPISITGWVSFSPQGYRSVLADRTEYWFDSYPEEKTSFSEEFFVTQEGTFQSPVPVIESLYAPHYRANDDGHMPVIVKAQE